MIMPGRGFCGWRRGCLKERLAARARSSASTRAAAETAARHDHRPPERGPDHRAEKPPRYCRGHPATSPARSSVSRPWQHSVAADTIRVYLASTPAHLRSDLIQKNFLNLCRPDCSTTSRSRPSAERPGVIVRAVVKERPRIGSVEYRGNKELNTAKINEAAGERTRSTSTSATPSSRPWSAARRASIKKAYSEGGFEGVVVDVTTEDSRSRVRRRSSSTSMRGRRRLSPRCTSSQHPLLRPPSSPADERSAAEQHRLLDPQEEPLHPLESWTKTWRRSRTSIRTTATRTSPSATPRSRRWAKGRSPRVKIIIPVKEGTVHTFGDVPSRQHRLHQRAAHRQLAAEEGRDHPPQADPDPPRRLR